MTQSTNNAPSLQQHSEDGVFTLSLNRPEVHNAFDDKLISALTQALRDAAADDSVRVVVLTGVGESFSAGADLNYMRSMIAASETANVADALRLAELMRTLQFIQKPTIARVNGSAFGGGIGLIACCDIAIATDNAKFGLTETKLGLVPAVISPYVVDAIGLRAARRWFQSAEVFDASTALQMQLLHEAVPASELDASVNRQIQILKKAGPIAVAHAKQLAFSMAGLNLQERENTDKTNASLIAKLRVSAEGQEGLSAFLEKRKSTWAGNS